MTHESLSSRIQALLRKRLGEVGVAPDLRNDDVAIAQICRDLGITREVVARELDEMRAQTAARIIGRERLPIGFLALKPALRRAMGRSAQHRASHLAQQEARDERDRTSSRSAFMEFDLG